jgi:hypothetical protein
MIHTRVVQPTALSPSFDRRVFTTDVAKKLTKSTSGGPQHLPTVQCRQNINRVQIWTLQGTYEKLVAIYQTTEQFIQKIRHIKELWMHESSKQKAIPLQAWTGPEGFRMLGLPEFLDNRHMKVVRLSGLRTGRLYPPGYIPGNHFC